MLIESYNGFVSAVIGNKNDPLPKTITGKMKDTRKEATGPTNRVKRDTRALEDIPGIVTALGRLGAGAVITEEGISHLFGRHGDSVKRAVERRELPPPVKLFGQPTWTVGVVLRHLEQRL